jgi:DNA-binding MarR family transcriptional regulator
MRKGDIASLKKVFSKAVTENQLLILAEAQSGSANITRLLVNLSEGAGIPLSTLKSSAKSLKEMGLIRYGGKNNNGPAETTLPGNLLLQILNDRYD